MLIISILVIVKTMTWSLLSKDLKVRKNERWSENKTIGKPRTRENEKVFSFKWTQRRIKE